MPPRTREVAAAATEDSIPGTSANDDDKDDEEDDEGAAAAAAAVVVAAVAVLEAAALASALPLWCPPSFSSLSWLCMVLKWRSGKGASSWPKTKTDATEGAAQYRTARGEWYTPTPSKDATSIRPCA